MSQTWNVHLLHLKSQNLIIRSLNGTNVKVILPGLRLLAVIQYVHYIPFFLLKRQPINHLKLGGCIPRLVRGH